MEENVCIQSREEYKIIGYSYDGCNGWTEWDTGDIFDNEVNAYRYKNERYDGIANTRYSVEK